jgi:hypothetical protein
MPALKGGTFALTTIMLIATATTTRSPGITSDGLTPCALARSGGGTYTISSTADVAADRLGLLRMTSRRKVGFGAPVLRMARSGEAHYRIPISIYPCLRMVWTSGSPELRSPP